MVLLDNKYAWEVEDNILKAQSYDKDQRIRNQERIP